jgi:leucyl aminopeptidase
MLECFANEETKQVVPIYLVTPEGYSDWLSSQPVATKNWLTAMQFKAEPHAIRTIPGDAGQLAGVICCVPDRKNMWGVGHLPFNLPEGVYQIDGLSSQDPDYATAWGLGAYQFTRYKKPTRNPAKLALPAKQAAHVENIVESIYLVRDWINTPTDDMGPTEFANAASKLAKSYDTSFSQIIGDDLLKQNYASIYTVGRASDDAPRLLDLRWGNPKHPKVTLVGKGVCFDSGGLDIKPSSYMLLMKKDMAGGAHVLGLARMVMQAKLPVCLRVLVPVVENVISGNAYRPGDVIKSRSGKTIEVGNTDAEGRVILADALTEAVSEKPDLLIDITTLTGAARVALGTELPAVFCNNDDLAAEIIKHGKNQYDPVWQMPLYAPYREFINSSIADINNNSSEPYGGAITAALFLKDFVPDTIPWLHFDMMAWNLRTRPGRPAGAEAMALRALFSYLSDRYITTKT